MENVSQNLPEKTPKLIETLSKNTFEKWEADDTKKTAITQNKTEQNIEDFQLIHNAKNITEKYKKTSRTENTQEQEAKKQKALYNNASCKHDYLIYNRDILHHGLDYSHSLTEANKNLQQLTITTGTLPTGAYLLELTSGVFSGFSAAIAAVLINHFYVKRTNKAKTKFRIANSIISLVDDLEDMSIKYWTQEKNDENNNDMKQLEILIISKCQTITHRTKLLYNEKNKNFIPTFGNNIITKIKRTKKNEKKTTGDLKYKTKKIAGEIFDIATGENFKSPTRPANNKTAQQISKKCNNLRSVLYEQFSKL